MKDPHRDFWNRVDHYFREFVDYGEEKLAEALAELKASDPLVAEEVRVLLSHAGRADDIFEQKLQAIPSALIDEALDDSIDYAIPSDGRVGPYRIIEEVGRGGWGKVYRAERADGVYEQEVAVKVLRRGLDTDDVLKRFRDERQILAALTHPHIARLIDGGALEDGRPYLVMEYVDGSPIDVFCDEMSLSLEERLKLFLQVCDAVSHAHRELVLHRDLKPSNILVRPDGAACLLDFGVARILSPGEAEASYTRTGQRLLTPLFAAPEQISGGHVSVPTDVYQLGLLLHRMLGARSAFDLPEDAPRAELYEAVLEGRVVPPSRAERLPESPDEHLLQGDIDTIVLKAVHLEPERRYQSAEALAADIRAYLGGFPVSARPDSAGYRLRKFAQRHRWGGMVAMALALVIILFMTLLVHQRGVALYERDRAQQEALWAEQVASFMVGLFEAGDPFLAPASEDGLTLRDVVDRGVADVAMLSEQPAVQARMYEALSRAFAGLGDFEMADSLSTQSLTLRTELFDTPHLEVAAALFRRGAVREKQGAYEASELYKREALVMRSAMLDPPHPYLAESMHGLALALQKQGRFDAADSLYREALAMRRSLHGADHPDVASTLSSLGVLLHEQGQYAEAEQLHREALEVNRAVYGDQHPQTVMSLNNLAQTLDWQGQHAEAEPLFREVLTMGREQLGDNHPEVATVLNNLAVVVENQGRLDEAERYKQEALDLERLVLGEDHPSVARSLNNLGVLNLKKRDFELAEAYFREALDLLERTLGPEHPHAIITTSSLARALERQGNMEGAISLAEKALDLMRSTFGEKHIRTAAGLNTLANIQRSAGAYDEAVSLHHQALEMRRALLGGDHPAIANSLYELAKTHNDNGYCSLAIPQYRESLRMMRKVTDEADVRTALIASGLGRCLVKERRFEESEPLLVKAKATLTEAGPAFERDLELVIQDLATLYRRQATGP